MKNDKQELLRCYLDGELNEDEEAEALHLIASDPELRSLLRFDMNIRQNISSPASGVPEGFADRVMFSIYAAEAVSTATAEHTAAHQAKSASKAATAEAGTTEQAGLLEWLYRFFEPRQVQWRPVWSAGLALGMLMLVFISAYTTGLLLQPSDMIDPVTPVTQVAEERADRVLMRFVYVDREAESVSVAGDFSDWEPIELSMISINGDQAWTGLIPLPRGEHRYMFIKDGEQWVTDPFAKTFRDDGFGNRNAVISL